MHTGRRQFQRRAGHPPRSRERAEAKAHYARERRDVDEDENLDGLSEEELKQKHPDKWRAWKERRGAIDNQERDTMERLNQKYRPR